MRSARNVLLATTATLVITSGVIFIIRNYFSRKLSASDQPFNAIEPLKLSLSDQLFNAIESFDFLRIKALLIIENEDTLIEGGAALLNMKNSDGHTPLEALLRSEHWPDSPRGDVWKKGYNCADILLRYSSLDVLEALYSNATIQSKLTSISAPESGMSHTQPLLDLFEWQLKSRQAIAEHRIFCRENGLDPRAMRAEVPEMHLVRSEQRSEWSTIFEIADHLREQRNLFNNAVASKTCEKSRNHVASSMLIVFQEGQRTHSRLIPLECAGETLREQMIDENNIFSYDDSAYMKAFLKHQIAINGESNKGHTYQINKIEQMKNQIVTSDYIANCDLPSEFAPIWEHSEQVLMYHLIHHKSFMNNVLIKFLNEAPIVDRKKIKVYGFFLLITSTRYACANCKQTMISGLTKVNEVFKASCEQLKIKLKPKIANAIFFNGIKPWRPGNKRAEESHAFKPNDYPEIVIDMRTLCGTPGIPKFYDLYVNETPADLVRSGAPAQIQLQSEGDGFYI